MIFVVTICDFHHLDLHDVHILLLVFVLEVDPLGDVHFEVRTFNFVQKVAHLEEIINILPYSHAFVFLSDDIAYILSN